MVVEAQTYKHNAFQALFEIKVSEGYSIQNSFSYATKFVWTWAKEKFPQLNVPDTPQTYKKELIGVGIKMIYSRQDMVFCMLTNQADDERVWETEVEISVKDDRLWFAVKNQYVNNDTIFEYDLCTVPNFVRTISEKMSLYDGGVEIGKLFTVKSEDDIMLLRCLVEDKERTLPVIVISQDLANDNMKEMYTVGNSYHVDGERLINELGFFAHVVYLPVNYQMSWKEAIGETFRVNGGSVRTYYPDFDAETQESSAHPFSTSSKILKMLYTKSDGEEITAGHAFRHILSHKIKYSSSRMRIDWAENGIEFYRLRRHKKEVEKYKSNQDTKAYLEMYEEQEKNYKNLESQFDADKKALEKQIDELRLINFQNQLEIDSLTEKLEALQAEGEYTYPEKYEDIPAWVEEHFAGRIYLHPRAKKALKNAVYENVEYVCKVIELLGKYYYKAKCIDESAYEKYKDGLKALNAEDLPAINETSAGTQGKEYYVEYHGKNYLLKKHITNGVSREARYTFRLYYFWEDDENILVIGSLPAHLNTRDT